MAQRILAGRYRLEAQIAAGGMGTVWRAHDQVLERPVAVKLLHDGLSDDVNASERFRREALTAAQLLHPNMAGVFDYVEDEGRPGIVMELVDGETLARRLARDGSLPVVEAVRVTVDVLAALEAAHAAGVVHRDIKPGNILLTSSGSVKVSDFGIARSLGDAGLTATGTVMGTAHYSAPEQVRGEPATPATDIYATGVMLYEMLTGTRPFDADTPIAVAMARLERDPDPPRARQPHVPAAVDAVVMRALARDPERRFGSAAEMRDALIAALGGTSPMPRTEALVVGAADPTIAMHAANGHAAPARTETDPPIAAYVPPRWAGRRLAIMLLPALLVGLLTFWIVAAMRSGPDAAPAARPTPSATAPPCCRVPGLVGKTVPQAQDLLERAGLVLDVGGYTPHATAARDTIVRQSVSPGEIISEGRTVVVTLSSGPPPRTEEKRDEDEGDGKGRRGKRGDD